MKTTTRSISVLESDIQWNKQEIDQLSKYATSYHCWAMGDETETATELATVRRMLAEDEAELAALKNGELKYGPIFLVDNAGVYK